MTLTTYFIKHPVISIIFNMMIIVLGVLSYHGIGINEYPTINVPAFKIMTRYPNASAELVETNVTNPLEDQLAGLEGVESISSVSKPGVSSIDLTFKESTPINRAQTSIREGITLARPMIDKKAKEPIIQNALQSDGLPFMALSLSGDITPGELNHFAELHLKNVFRSIKGLSNLEVWGSPYTMVVTLDAQKLYTFGVNPHDILDSIERSHLSWPVGKFQGEIPTTMDFLLKTMEDFETFLIKDANNKMIPLKTVGDIALKTDEETSRIRINQKPGLVLSISRSNDSNPLEVSTLVQEMVKKIQTTLPSSLSLNIVLDQAEFIRASLKNIQHSILEAIVLVLIIVFLFLRNMRATLIPLVTVPISLIGSLIFFKLFGYSINTLTLLAMVLAIGLVVDDAIVVLENIARHIEEGNSPKEASLKGAQEIGFAIIAMTLTLASVYAPIAFIQGVVGQLFIEFGVALAGSVLISGVVALTLSPLMCSTLLKKQHQTLWPQIDQAISFIETKYQTILSYLMNHPSFVISITFSIICSLFYFFMHLPQELIPKEDRGMLGVFMPSVPGKGLDFLDSRSKQVEDILTKIPEGTHMLTFMGSWGGNVVLSLKDHIQRKRTAAEIVNTISPQTEKIPTINTFPWNLDSGLPGLVNMDSSALILEVSTSGSYRDLLKNLDRLKKKMNASGQFQDVRHNLFLDSPSYAVEIDHHGMTKVGLSAEDIAKSIEIFFSHDRNLQFVIDHVSYPLTIKGEEKPWTLDELYLTNPKGKRISLGAIAKLSFTTTPKELNHFNQMRTASVIAELLPGQSLKEGMDLMWKHAKKNLDPTLKTEWRGVAKLQSQSSSSMWFLLLMSLIFIYAILSIQFENFLDPAIIMLTVPLGCFGALIVAWVFNQSLNIYTQIGLVTLIGLITKHGILIIEFSNQLIQRGFSIKEAILKASTQRLRPILMTTSAMVLGSFPLILSKGAGMEARQAIGFILVGGLTFGTGFTLFILPKLYLMIKVRTI